jgi:hypothetical protein
MVKAFLRSNKYGNSGDVAMEIEKDGLLRKNTTLRSQEGFIAYKAI